MLATWMLLGWLAACAYQDLRRRKVDNLLTFGGLAAAAAYLYLHGHSLTQHSVAARIGRIGNTMTPPNQWNALA